MDTAYVVSLGHEGSADCCLVLSHEGQSKEFLIESPGWRILNTIIDDVTLPADFTSDCDTWEVCDLLWRFYNPEDLR